MKRTLFLLLALCLVSLSFGRVGPVSQYGQLMAGKAGTRARSTAAVKALNLVKKWLCRA